jgi:argininosuccinate lyase
LRDGFFEAEAVLRLSTATLKTMRVKAEVAEARTAYNFSTVTELADVMVRERGLSFREAHMIVGTAVGELCDRGGRTPDLTTDMLDRIAQERLGHALGLSEASLRNAVSATANVNIRCVKGGPAPSEALRSVKASRERFASQEAWWREREAELKAARQRLDIAASELAKS